MHVVYEDYRKVTLLGFGVFFLYLIMLLHLNVRDKLNTPSIEQRNVTN